jgi:proteasome lid subunit RPN8/RPN11
VFVLPPGSNADMNETDQTCGRIDVDETLPSIKVPRHILNELYSHALETLPEECCGLIVGTDQKRFNRFVRCRNEMTLQHRKDRVAYPRDGRQAFLMNGLDYMRVIEEAEECGEKVTAVYHSHVDAGAYLSAMDREYAESELFPFPGADQVVVSVVERKVDSVAFFRHDKRARAFLGHTIVPTAE